MIRSTQERSMFCSGRAAARAASIFGLLAALAACGGGGSSSPPPPPPPPPPLVVTVTETALDATFTEGQTPALQQIHIALSGTIPTGGVYLDVQADTSAVLSIDDQFAGMRATSQLTLDPSLAAGDYAGTVTVRFCTDSACNDPIAGATKTLPLTLHVARAFRFPNGDQITLNAVSGHGVTSHVVVELPDGVSTYAVDTSQTPWLTVANQAADGFDLVTRSIPVGVYGAPVQVSTGGAQITLNVAYEVASPAGGQHDLKVGVASLATTASLTASADLAVSPPTWQPALEVALSYPKTGEPTGWLTYAPSADGYLLTADAGALPKGTYTAALSFTGDSYTTPVTRLVTLTVAGGLPHLAAQRFTVGAETPASTLTLTVPIPSTGATVAWSAVCGDPWIVIDTPTGLTGDSLTLHVSPTVEATLQNQQTHVAAVTVQQPGVPYDNSTFYVTLDKRLPEVHGVGPSTLTSGRAQSLRVRGAGFGSVADLSARVAVGGVTGYPVTPINDTEIVVHLPALAAGVQAVSVTNAVGDPTSSASAQWVDPVTRPYQFFTLSGNKGGLTWDPVRETLYTVNQAQFALVAWHWDGTQWSKSTHAVPSAVTMGMASDRSQLIVGASSGLLHLLSPDTLVESASVTVPKASIYFQASSEQGMPVTNDNRVWFASPMWDYLQYYDLRTGTFGTALDGPRTYTANVGVVSRNGERLVTVPDMGSGSGLMYYLDAKDDRMKVVCCDAVVLERASLDDAGDRLLNSWGSTVYDVSFNVVGTVDFYGTAYGLSAAGDRAYVLVYPTSGSPTIEVFDSTRKPSGGTALPMVGSFTIADSPGCGPVSPCYEHSQIVLAPDGQTMFIAGPYGVAVVPIPASFQGHVTLAAARRTAAATLKANAHRAGPMRMPMPPR
jgi:hypothetical protein